MKYLKKLFAMLNSDVLGNEKQYETTHEEIGKLFVFEKNSRDGYCEIPVENSSMIIVNVLPSRISKNDIKLINDMRKDLLGYINQSCEKRLGLKKISCIEIENCIDGMANLIVTGIDENDLEIEFHCNVKKHFSK